MKQRPRRYFTDSEMALVWDWWRKGESLNAIARNLDRRHSAVQGALARNGPWQLNDNMLSGQKLYNAAVREHDI